MQSFRALCVLARPASSRTLATNSNYARIAYKSARSTRWIRIAGRETRQSHSPWTRVERLFQTSAGKLGQLVCHGRVT